MSNQANILLRNLPEIFQDSEDLRTLLTAFEDVLFGTEQGLEQKIANIPNLFNPKPGRATSGTFDRTPVEFLPWLAQWVALEHLYVMPEEQYRKLIAKIVPLYALRGTKKYLKEILALFFPEIEVTISDEALPSMKVGESRVGKDTRLGGDIPFYFYVKLQFPGHSNAHSNSQDDSLLERICSVIDSAKPAYTAYQLECVFEDAEDSHKNTDNWADNA
jgi:phage tail-like protein